VGSREREAALASTLLVQACEESDPEGRFLPHRERDAAAKAARAAVEEPDGGEDADAVRIARRADRLAEPLVAHHAALRLARRAAIVAPPALPVFAIALAFGLAADALGARQRVSVLAFPLLTLLAWNFAVYLSLAGARLFGGHGSSPSDGGSPRAAGALARAGLWLAERRARFAAPEEARWLAASLRRFAALYTRACGALVAARARLLLHVGALGFAAGLVAGMYLRGLVLEYRASWESTFLDPPAVSALLQIALGPSAALLDALRGETAASALLRPDSIEALRAPGSGPAALWIHLWALTAALGIGVPRAVLAALAARRVRALARALAPPLEDPYYLRLRAADRGEGLRVLVSPYSHRPSARAQDRLLELLHELYGNRAQLTVAEPVAYGAEPPGAASDARVALFNLAQPPEQEVHGAFVEALRSAAPGSLLVLLDEEPYLARMGEDGAARLAQRRRAWERMLRDAGVSAAILPASLDAEGRALAAARAALAGAGASR
jgi:hypothetical protein